MPQHQFITDINAKPARDPGAPELPPEESPPAAEPVENHDQKLTTHHLTLAVDQNNVAPPPTPPRSVAPAPAVPASPAAPTPGLDGPPPEPPAVKPKKKKLFGGISRDTSEYVIESLSMLLLSGVTVGEAIEAIAAEIPKKQSREAILTMRTSIDEGVPFSKAIEQTGLFGASVITLIEVGESTGKLPENLRVVATQMHKNNTMNAKIKSAMLYPAFLLTLLFVVGTGIGVFLLPKLLDIINSLQVPIGPVTKALIIFGTFFGHYGLLLAGVAVVFGLFLFVGIRKSDFIRTAVEAVLFKIPGIKKLLFETEISRFGFVLGTLLEAGLPVVTALESLAASMSTRRYAKFSNELQTRIDEGDSFSKVLSEQKYRKLMPGTICQIVISAEKSGNLSSSLLKVGTNYEDKADLTAQNLETLLEPIVLVLIAIGVLFVAMAVFLPIYSLVGNLNGK